MKNKIIQMYLKALLFIPLVLTHECNFVNAQTVKIENALITVEYDSNLYSRIIIKHDSSCHTKEEFIPSEYVLINSKKLYQFKLKNYRYCDNENGRKLVATGLGKLDGFEIEKTLTAKADNKYPEFIFTNVKYVNKSKTPVSVTGWVNNHYVIPQNDTAEVFWSFQDASYEERPDWVRKVPYGFKQENYLGMNATDYGGGTPVVDVWKKNFGIAVGHLETVPKLVSLPVSRSVNGVEIKVKYNKDFILEPGDTLQTFSTFVAVHRGDYFHTLKMYSEIMQRKGLKIKKAPETAYEPVWCAWGYERNFKVEEILTALPKVKDVGLKWVVIDDGWQTAEGDWYLNPEKFPNGEAGMKDLVSKIHKMGFKAKLWWVPLAVDPETDLIKNHKDMLLINKNGKPQDISWWDAYYLCPAYKPTLEYTKKMVHKFIEEWGFDGLKIDGQHLNAAPPCYNHEHHHKYPEESTEAMPSFFKTIYEEVTKLKPESVVEVCPCGTGYNFFMLPYLNQVVASDPVSSWQIRLKGKTFKALMGSSAPYYGDHVELSTGGDDFASTIGVGGVVGTKFVWPPGSHLNTESGDISLTPEREKEWKKWIKIYEEHKLPEGEYLGELYDIGFDKPETHVIKKGDTLFYAFYSENFEGEVELRGLDKGRNYFIFDYVNDKLLKKITGAKQFVPVKFNDYLLLKVFEDN